MVKAAQTCLGAEFLLVDHHRIAGIAWLESTWLEKYVESIDEYR
jgi:hypothetical protein